MNRLQLIRQSVSKTLTSKSWDILYGTGKDNEHTLLSNPYNKSAIVHSCIKKTATTISQVDLLMMKKGKEPSKNLRKMPLLEVEKNKTYFVQKTNPLMPTYVIQRVPSGNLVVWEPADDSTPWQALFNRPNYLLSSTLMVESLVSWYMLTGNVWLIGFPLSKNVIPDSLWVVDIKTMKPNKDSRGHLLGWNYDPRGHDMFNSSDIPKMMIDIEDRVCHIKRWNPDDIIMGLSPFEPAKIPLKTDFKAAQYNNKFFDGDGIVMGSLSTDKKMEPEQVRQYRQQWNESHGGVDNVNNVAILHSGLKYQTYGVTHADMQYIDLRRYSRDEIIQLLDMNKAILSITDDLNYATNKGQEKIWWQTGNIPKCRAIEEGISWQFLKNDSNIKVMFDLSTVDALQEDFKEKTEIARSYWAMGISFNTINERLNLGFDGDIPGADVGYLPLSFMPVEGRDYVPEPELLPQMPPEEPTIQELMPPINIEVKYLDIINLKSKEWETRSEKCWKRVTNEVSKIEIPFAKKIQKVFFEFRKNMLSVLNTGSPKKNKSDIVIKRDSLEAINDINEYTANIERALMQKYSIGYFDLGVTQGIDTLINEIGGNRIQVTDPLITSYFLAKQTKIVSVIDTIKHAIEHQMKLGAMEGEDVVKLEARIKKVFGVADRRAHVIARTEMGGAMNFGRYAQINTSSFKNKVWFTALDERVRGVDGENVPFNHADMHGKKLQIGVTSHWDVNGESLDYPGDYKGSASNIIQCRCIETVDIEEI